MKAMNAPRFPSRLGLVLFFVLTCMGSPIATARAKPTTAGKVTQYPLPQGHNPWGSIASGPDGNLWFLEFPGNRVGKMTTQGAYTEYAIPTSTSRPVGITAGPDGNLWFTEEGFGGCIGKMTLKGRFTTFALPNDSDPRGITSGPDGNLWFTLDAGGIERMTPQGALPEYSIGGTTPDGITVGPDTNHRFVETVGEIGMITWK